MRAVRPGERPSQRRARAASPCRAAATRSLRRSLWLVRANGRGGGASEPHPSSRRLCFALLRPTWPQGEPVWRYMLSLGMADHTRAEWLTSFSDTSEVRCAQRQRHHLPRRSGPASRPAASRTPRDGEQQPVARAKGVGARAVSGSPVVEQFCEALLPLCVCARVRGGEGALPRADGGRVPAPRAGRAQLHGAHERRESPSPTRRAPVTHLGPVSKSARTRPKCPSGPTVQRARVQRAHVPHASRALFTSLLCTNFLAAAPPLLLPGADDPVPHAGVPHQGARGLVPGRGPHAPQPLPSRVHEPRARRMGECARASHPSLSAPATQRAAASARQGGWGQRARRGTW